MNVLAKPRGNFHATAAYGARVRSDFGVVPRFVLQVTASVFVLASILHGSAAAWDPGCREIAVTVRDTTGLSSRRPVTGGIPVATGSAPRGSCFFLSDEHGEKVPCQATVLARWKDGSVRWVLIDFQATPPPHGTARFTLTWSEHGRGSMPHVPVNKVDDAKGVIQTGTIRIGPAADALLRISDRIDVRFVLTDDRGHRCRGVVESSVVESSGPVRGTLLLRGAFRGPEGTRLLGFRLRASVFAGLSTVFLEPHLLVDADTGVIHRLRGLSLDIVPRTAPKGFQIGGELEKRPQGDVRLLQIDDKTVRFDGVKRVGVKSPGWAELTDGAGTVAVAVRDFWQQWPKSLEADSQGLKIGLFPTFSPGTFDHMGPWYKHQYLFDGDCYRLRTGQSRRWRIWLDMRGDGVSLARSTNAPLVPAADPEQAIAAGVWGPIPAAGGPAMEAYDRWAENLFIMGYLNSIKLQRDYGAMNWGDWWGERGCNWGNHEYDTPKHILVQFARTGDPKYFHVGDTAARHTSEVDVIQFVNSELIEYFHKTVGKHSSYPIRAGMVHEHCVGHVSGFYPVDRIRELYVSLGIGGTKHPYLCLDPYNLGHIWTQGMVYDYFLTGDPWMKETVEKIGANLVRLVEDRKFPFKGGSHSGRVNGWTMLAIAGAYELNFDERYLKAMKLLADDALSEQDLKTGGWRYKLPSGHCNCKTKHWGEAAFISAIRLNGLSKYYELTGDPRIPAAVRRGVTHMNRDTWEEQHSGWRYTSCPKSASGPGRQAGVIVMALVNSVTMTGDAEHLRILRKAWKSKFDRLLVAPTSRPGLGKTYSTIMYGCPEAMQLFANDPNDPQNRVTAAKTDKNVASSATVSDATTLVAKLGADSYQQRTSAFREILALGPAALAALRDGLHTPDLQTRRSCRRLLDVILDADLKKRIEKLTENGTSVPDGDLPGWRQFREVAGDDQPARELFASMLRAEPALFESFVSGPDAARKALELRLQHVFMQAHLGSINQRRMPTLPSIASFMFVASEPSCQPLGGRLVSVISLLQRTDFAKKLKEGTANKTLVRLLGRFLLSADDAQLARPCLQLGITLKVQQPTIRLALRVLDSADQHQPTTVAGAVGVVGILGGRDYCGALPALLKDERTCATRTWKKKRRTIQVRDVVAAWLVHGTGQKLKDYGLESADGWFKSIGQRPSMCFSVSNIIFASDTLRDTALAKLRTWLAKNPLGTVPLEPAPGRSKVAGQPIPAGTNQPHKVKNQQPGLALADYLVVRQLDKARELVGKRRYSEAVRSLGDILQADDDLIYKPKGEEQSVRNLKAEAESILAAVPSAGLQAYELHFGPLAKRRLDEAIDAADIDRLADVERKYFFSEAGWQAASILALYYRQHGEPYMASVYLQRLQRRNGLDAQVRATLPLELAVCWLLAGKPEAARRQLIAWKRGWTQPDVLLGNQRIALFGNGEDPCRWLSRALRINGHAGDDWLVPRGDITGQNDYSGGPMWLDGNTLFPVGNTGYLESLLKQVDDDLQRRRIAVIPTVQPLVIGQSLVLRTITGLRAIDRSTGALQWESPAENALTSMLRNADSEQRKQLADVVRTGLERRLRADIGWGAITSNGQLIFAVEDVGFDLGMSYQCVVTRMDGRRQLDMAAYQRENSLSAYDAETGKQVWQVGDAFGDVTSELQGGRFLGPPLPLGDQLYAPVDFPDSTRLVLLDAETGLLRRQWVLDVREVVPRVLPGFSRPAQSQSPNRCAPPVFADGVLVCGTGSGKFTAIDIVAGVALWTREIKRTQPRLPLPWGMMAPFAQWQRGKTNRWAATAATIVDTRVLLTQVESEELHCIDLRSGEQLWSAGRHDGLYVAGTDEGVLLIVERSGVRALRLANGAPAWDVEMVHFRSGAVPVGRGYLSEHAYYVPLSTGEVVGLDIRTGRQLGKILSAEPIQLGNLVTVRDNVFSAGLRSAHSFQLLSNVSQDQPEKAEDAQSGARAVADHVRRELAAGRVNKALQWLVQSGRTEWTPQELQLLSQALLLDLCENPRGFADHFALLDEFTLSQPHRTADWLDLAEALIECRYPEQAAKLYERLGSAAAPLNEVFVVEAARTLRADRRIAAGLQQIADAKKPADGQTSRFIDTVAGKFPSIAILLHNRQSAREGLPLSLSAQAHDQAMASLWGRPKIDVQKKPVPKGNSTDPLHNGQQIPVLLDRVAQMPTPQLSVTYETRTRTLSAIDRWGRPCAQVVLPSIKAKNTLLINPSFSYLHGVAVGDLLVFYRGDIVTAVDCGAKKSSLRWTKDLRPREQDNTTQWQMLRAARQPLLLTRVTCPGTQPRSVAAGPDYVCFQCGRGLTAVDPSTGDVLWSRDDLAANSDLTGDIQRIYATPPHGEETLVFASLDGRLLGRRRNVQLADRIGVVDGLPLLCRQDNGQKTCGLYDPWQQDFVWQRNVSGNAVLAMAGPDAVGIVQPNGTAVVLDVSDGHEILTAELGPFDKVDDVAFLRSGDVYVLATHLKKEAMQQSPFNARLMPGEKLVNGKWFGLRQGSGKVLWTLPATNQRLRTNQPNAVPLLIACNRPLQLVRTNNTSRWLNTQRLVLMCIDTRTGKVLHDSSNKATGRANYLFATDPAKQKATLTTATEIVELRMRDG